LNLDNLEKIATSLESVDLSELQEHLKISKFGYIKIAVLIRYLETFNPQRVKKMLAVVQAAIILYENSAKAPIGSWQELDKALEELENG